MPWQCGREAALRSSRAGLRPALGHLRARSLPPGRTTTSRRRRRRPRRGPRGRDRREQRLRRGRARPPGSSRGDSSTRRPNGLRDIRDAALRPGAGQGRAQREARRAASLTGEDRGAAGDVRGVGALRDHGDEVRDAAGKVAEIVSLGGLRGRRRLPRGRSVQKTFGEKGCGASFFSRGRLRRLPGALARGRSGRGARAPQRQRGAQRSAPRSSRSQCQRLQRRVGVADAAAVDGLARRSPAPTPGRGAQLASTAGACGGAFAGAVSRPFSDRA